MSPIRSQTRRKIVDEDDDDDDDDILEIEIMRLGLESLFFFLFEIRSRLGFDDVDLWHKSEISPFRAFYVARSTVMGQASQPRIHNHPARFSLLFHVPFSPCLLDFVGFRPLFFFMLEVSHKINNEVCFLVSFLFCASLSQSA